MLGLEAHETNYKNVLQEHATNLIYSSDVATRLLQEEKDAMLLCSGLLGECYMLQEVAESYLTDALSAWSKCKWFKQDLKKNLKKIRETLHECIVVSRSNSMSNSEIMMGMSDKLYDLLKGDLDKMTFGMANEMSKDVEDAREIGMFLVVDALLRYIELRYKGIIGYMKTIVNTNYEDFYYQAGCPKALRYTNLAMEGFSRFISYDASDSKTLADGLKVIKNKMKGFLEEDDREFKEEKTEKMFVNALDNLKERINESK